MHQHETKTTQSLLHFCYTCEGAHSCETEEASHTCWSEKGFQVEANDENVTAELFRQYAF